MRHLKLSPLFVMFLLASLCWSTETEAADGTTYEVGASILHVREEPAYSGNIVGILHKGDRLTAFQEKYGWVQTYYAGEIAWVAKHHLISVQTDSGVSNTVRTSSSVNESITISAPSVNIRSGPGLDYRVIAGTASGDSFQPLDYSGEWIKISLGDGNTGWVASWLTNANNSNDHTSEVGQVASVKTNQPSSGVSSLAGYTIVLDAGHGGRDPGAIGLSGIREKGIIQTTTGKIANTLRAHGATVIETRTSDYFLTLDERIHLSNSYGTDAFISVHYNSFPVVSVQGFHTFYFSENSARLARSVHSNIDSSVPLTNRGTAQADFKVLRNTYAPAILLELGFITNPYDLSVVQTAEYQNQVSEAIARGLQQFFN